MFQEGGEQEGGGRGPYPLSSPFVQRAEDHNRPFHG